MEDELSRSATCDPVRLSSCSPPGSQDGDAAEGPCRVVLHLDMDCFYAQVEMIRNPALRAVPLGVQQKYIIVTCNYVARQHGVKKMMLVTDAKEKCPQLVLVSGEDLTRYREASYSVTALLEKFCHQVERLGFDENFMDVTELVESRLKQETKPADISVNGHVYDSLDTGVQDHRRLALGSHIAAEIRATVHRQLGLTACAGVASNKLLAKLVSGAFKPNQQTTLLPESTAHLLGSLRGPHAVPGIGYRTACRLEALGLCTLEDLHRVPLVELEKELGAAAARRVRSLSLGVDPSPVTPSRPPQSLSNEDSFKKVSTEVEVKKKVEELMITLLDRMHKDGRTPRTLRLTIRRFSRTVNKWFNRESRQCPVPGLLGHKIRSGGGDALGPLVKLAMKLFHRMVDTRVPFHLTLLSVCFSNLQSPCTAKRGSIQAFFAHESPHKRRMDSPSQARTSLMKPVSPQGALFEDMDSGGRLTTGGRPQDGHLGSSCVCDNVSLTPPAGVDPHVFRDLPADIQKELLSSSTVDTVLRCPSSAGPSDSEPGFVTGLHLSSSECLQQRHPVELHTESRSPVCDVPPHIDPQVFAELPPELQRELLSEWTRKTSAVKMQGSKLATASSSQTNNLLRYFKPS
uniref:Polymerase (DNA directed) iota n=1 Tax=Scleropages formosus TaxID=113540 RepID=A0A8C9QQX1_SCLFO